MNDQRHSQGIRDTVCIDTYRILDSCRDKDCYENVRVFLTGCGEELLQRGAPIRAKSAKIAWAYIDIDPVPFNRGFYQLSIKLYIRVICEVCISPGNVREVEGISVIEKRVILFGSEGNVSIFKSGCGCSGFCHKKGDGGCTKTSNLPIAVLETVEPIILDSKVIEPHLCKCFCSCSDDIPAGVCTHLDEPLVDGHGDRLAITLGLFSVVRIERPAQYVINASEYCVPDKQCFEAEDTDPCKLFRSMAFPTSEFCPPHICTIGKTDYKSDTKNCGCS